jgi:HAD superfamily hydrolase (TIGR01549 family)
MKSNIRAVVFDAFGTVVEIRNKQMPYRRLVEEAARRNAAPVDASMLLMSNPLGLVESALALGLDIDDASVNLMLKELKIALQLELDSVALFPDVLETFDKLQYEGLTLAICSNLALPYAEPVVRLTGVPQSNCIWSFNTAAIKPMPEIFAHTCKQLQVEAQEVLFVGDTRQSDVLGPRKFGMKALHLVRSAPTVQRDQIQNLQGVLNFLGLKG